MVSDGPKHLDSSLGLKYSASILSTCSDAGNRGENQCVVAAMDNCLSVARADDVPRASLLHFDIAE